MKLYFDVETRSLVDLKKFSQLHYMTSKHTEVWMVSWVITDNPASVTLDDISEWRPGEPVPEAIITHVKSGGMIGAWNISFDDAAWRHILVRHGWPEYELHQLDDLMARGRYNNVPGGLDKAPAAAGVDVAKDMGGATLMRKLAKARNVRGRKIVWWDDPKLVDALGLYCRVDTHTMVHTEAALYPMPDSEQTVWSYHHRINRRGIHVDKDMVEACIDVMDIEADRLHEKVAEITDGKVPRTSNVGAMKDYLHDSGISVGSLNASAVTDLLTDDELPPDCRAMLACRQQAGKASTGKLKKLLLKVDSDGRLRDMLVYYAAITGRFGSRGVQLHNMVRPGYSFETMLSVASVIMERDPDALRAIYGDPLTMISWSTRSLFDAAPGKILRAVDYANIEGRALAWLANAHWKLDAFRAYDNGAGPDLYLVAAAGIYGGTPESNKPNRQIGKVAELALGFGGGVGAFQSMAANYGVKLPDEQVDTIKTNWREANPEIKQYWYDLEAAAKRAIQRPGRKFTPNAEAPPVVYRSDGTNLYCRLPTGRVLFYRDVGLKTEDTDWGKRTAIMYNTVKGGRSARVSTWGGKLAENVTQAVAREPLTEAIIRLEQAGFPVVLHVHDEIVTETDPGFESLDSMAQLMLPSSSVYDGLPFATDGWEGPRFRK